MSKKGADIWDQIASQYSDEQVTRCDEVHFGIGMPGNSTLRIVPEAGPGGTVLDLGCGDGHNIVALSALGYSVTGVDSSEAQLNLAIELVKDHGIDCTLVRDDALSLSKVAGTFDLVFCGGVAHFSDNLDVFIASCAKLTKPGGMLVVIVPHPIEMVAAIDQIGGKREIVLGDYFPDGNIVKNAYYWRRFAGKNDPAIEVKEFLCRPSDLVRAMLRNGFSIGGIWEPCVASHPSDAPCYYKDLAPWFSAEEFKRMPQILIVKGILGNTGAAI